MARRSPVPQTILWLFVLSASILTGGSVFEHVVVTPLWAGSPPESVMHWQYHGIQSKFFMVVSPLYALTALLLLIASRWMPRAQKTSAFIAGVSGVVVFAATLLFFLPILGKTQVTNGAGLSGEEITRLVHQFVTWNWVRWAVLIGGWIAGLRALSLSAMPGAR